MDKSEPIPRRVLRHYCPHCGKSRSARTAAVNHIARCFKNPAAKSCRTCACYQPVEQPEYSDYGRPSYPGCPEGCDAGVNIEAGPVTNCALWEARRLITESMETRHDG
jgi:hypothetical protein